MKDIQITMNEPDTWMDKTGGYAKDMTLRDYFAAKAMQAEIAANEGLFKHQDLQFQVAKISYEMADAMLKAMEA